MIFFFNANFCSEANLRPSGILQWPSAKCQKIQLNTSLLNMKLPKYDLVGGYVGLVVGARWGALHGGMHFSPSKSALLLNFMLEFCL